MTVRSRAGRCQSGRDVANYRLLVKSIHKRAKAVHEVLERVATRTCRGHHDGCIRLVHSGWHGRDEESLRASAERKKSDNDAKHLR